MSPSLHQGPGEASPRIQSHELKQGEHGQGDITKVLLTSNPSLSKVGQRSVSSVPNVSDSFLLLLVRPGAPSSFLLLLVRHLLLLAWHLFLLFEVQRKWSKQSGHPREG